MVQPSVVLIKILQCNFTNNSASGFGGGLYIFSPVLFTEEDFTIADNYFEKNEAVNGGGIALGATFQLTDGKEFLYKDVLTESVIFSRNTFVRNRATVGGAMFLLVPGQWTIECNAYCLSFLKFEGCNNACLCASMYLLCAAHVV